VNVVARERKRPSLIGKFNGRESLPTEPEEAWFADLDLNRRNLCVEKRQRERKEKEKEVAFHGKVFHFDQR
jgi:hypothetical protein